MNVSQRFWSKVNMKGPDECWPWTGARNTRGYGNLKIAGKVVSAHVFAFIDKNDYQPPVVRHSCDNRACYNPHHLLGGTQQDNVADTVARGRTNRGERNGHAKLTYEQVKAIRARFVRGCPVNGNEALAKEFGFSSGGMSSLITGRTWKEPA